MKILNGLTHIILEYLTKKGMTQGLFPTNKKVRLCRNCISLTLRSNFFKRIQDQLTMYRNIHPTITSAIISAIPPALSFLFPYFNTQ